MKAEDLKTKTPDELKSELLNLKKQQLNLRFQLSQGQLANHSQLRVLRRDIARVQMFMNPASAKVAQGSKIKKAAKAKTADAPDAPAKKTAKKPAKKSAA